MDATLLLPGLAIGSAPESARAVWDAGFQTLVLCAREIQPPDSAFVGSRVRVLRCPLDDNPFVPLTAAERAGALRTALAVVRGIRSGRNVLVTCAQGRNRSGLVSAMVIHLITGWSGADCVAYVQRRRANSLLNPQFVRELNRLPRRAA